MTIKERLRTFWRKISQHKVPYGLSAAEAKIYVVSNQACFLGLLVQIVIFQGLVVGWLLLIRHDYTRYFDYLYSAIPLVFNGICSLLMFIFRDRFKNIYIFTIIYGSLISLNGILICLYYGEQYGLHFAILGIAGAGVYILWRSKVWLVFTFALLYIGMMAMKSFFLFGKPFLPIDYEPVSITFSYLGYTVTIFTVMLIYYYNTAQSVEVEENLAGEQKKSDALLLNILPENTAQELKQHGFSRPNYHEESTVLFTDFVGFTKIAENMSPEELVAELDKCFSYFDQVSERYRLEKLKTIGDAYMCAGGIPSPNKTHALDCALAAIEIQAFMNQMKTIKESQGYPFWELRLGMHSGPLVAGVIGTKKFAYDVWGDTVNVASRMESSGTPGRINISGDMHQRIGLFFRTQYRGKISAKNKGEIDMYYLLGLKPQFAEDDAGRVPNKKFWHYYTAIQQGKRVIRQPKHMKTYSKAK